MATDCTTKSVIAAITDTRPADRLKGVSIPSSECSFGARKVKTMSRMAAVTRVTHVNAPCTSLISTPKAELEQSEQVGERIVMSDRDGRVKLEPSVAFALWRAEIKSPGDLLLMVELRLAAAAADAVV